MSNLTMQPIHDFVFVNNIGMRLYRSIAAPSLDEALKQFRKVFPKNKFEIKSITLADKGVYIYE